MKKPLENNRIKWRVGVPEVPRVSIVDDDESVREAIKSLVKSVGLGAEVFASAEDFLKSDCLDDTASLILDVRMQGMGGLELQHRLASTNSRIPIIFITAHGDEETRRQALRFGAIAFLHKPFSEEALLDAVYAALETGGGSALRP
jgi:FixJ family two-component response regulator